MSAEDLGGGLNGNWSGGLSDGYGEEEGRGNGDDEEVRCLAEDGEVVQYRECDEVEEFVAKSCNCLKWNGHACSG